MNSEQIANGMLSWINTFTNLSRPVNSMLDLCDGVILYEILFDIDAKWFRVSKPTESGDNWVLRVNNLKKIHKMLTRYYDEVLNLSTANLTSPNLNAIAKENNIDELINLCKLIVTAAVQCERRQTYIVEIQRLEPEVQQVLMLSIEEVMAVVVSNVMDAESEMLFSPTASRIDASARLDMNDVEEQLFRLQMEYNRIINEKKELESTHHQLIEKHGRLSSKYDELLAERDDLRAKLAELERAVEEARESGKNDFLLRSEIDQLRYDLEKCEAKLNDSEMQVESQNATIMDLNRKVEDLSRKAEQAAKLRDQVQELRHTAEKLRKAEQAKEKYRKRLEDYKNLRQQVKTLEEQNRFLVEKNQQLEEEYRKVSMFKPKIESYKEQIQALETKSNQLTMEKAQLEYEIQRYQERITLAELEKQNFTEQINALEERLKELEFSGGQMMTDAPPADGDDDDDDDAATLSAPGERVADALSNKVQFELKARIIELEREIQQLRHNRGDDSLAQRIVLLESQLEDTNKMKNKFEEQYLEAHQRNMTLESEIDRLKNTVATGLDHDASLQLRVRLSQSEEEYAATKRRLAEVEAELQKVNKELAIARSNLALVDKDKLDALEQIRAEVSHELSDLEKEHAALKERCKDLEADVQRHLGRITQLLEEKDKLQSQVVQHKDQLLKKEEAISDLNRTLAMLQSKEQNNADQISQQLMAETQKNLRLQDINNQQQEQIQQLVVKLHKAKEFIRQSQLYQNVRSGGAAPQDNYSEAITSLQAELKAAKEEAERYKNKLAEERARMRMERQLMASAWYEHGRQMQSSYHSKQHRPNKNTAPYEPCSWLNAQRSIAGQARRR